VSNDDVTCARCIALHANSYVCYISSIECNDFAVSYNITYVVLMWHMEEINSAN